MLDPHDRTLLLESLRPPDGFDLSSALGTTYSLDLNALLTVPLAFSRFDMEQADGEMDREPFALLEALRRHADQVTVFCQAGGISLPSRQHPLFVYIENCIVQVSPRSGIFHPKLWILRFTNRSDDVAYRLVCLSRNLTFDKSWDTCLVMDGPLCARQNAFATNRPLSRFVAALPALASVRMGRGRAQRISMIADELLRVKFELPESFNEVAFLPMGVDETDPAFFDDKFDRMLIVSPFLDNAVLKSVSQKRSSVTVISRVESLQQIDPKLLKRLRRVCVLDNATSSPVIEASEASSESATTLEGLHAKLFVVESGRDTLVYTGSANATSPAFHENVEFLVRLTGPRSKIGIDALLTVEKGKTSFADLLQPYSPATQYVEVDKDLEELERTADKAIREFAAQSLAARVSPGDLPNEWAVRLETSAPKGVRFPAEIGSVACWPVTVAETMAASVRQGEKSVATFEALSSQALTPFYAFRFTAQKGGRKLEKTRVVVVPLVGGPADRQEQVLRSILDNKDRLLQFLFFLLAEDGGEGPAGDDHGSTWGSPDEYLFAQQTLFESMVRALHRYPERIDEIERLIADLEKTSGRDTCLPVGFREIWDPILAARKGHRP